MRMIDADALIEKMKDCGFSTAQELMANAFCFAALKSESLAPTIGGWISVKDRLPEKDGRYLCWFGKNKNLIGAEIETYVREWEGFGNVESYTVFENITHWMPLPEPPKEELDD